MGEFAWDPFKPLARGRYEGKNANAALHDYATLGTTRSLRKLHDIYEQRAKDALIKDADPLQQPTMRTRSQKTLDGWSKRYSWQKRIEQWDELVKAEQLQLWGERQLLVRDQDWEHGGKLRKLAADILAAAPLYVRETISVEYDDRGEMYKVVTRALDAHALEKIEALASKLQRLAAEMETNRTDITSGGKAIKVIGGVNLDDV
jgi:hypothetical protein